MRCACLLALHGNTLALYKLVLLVAQTRQVRVFCSFCRNYISETANFQANATGRIIRWVTLIFTLVYILHIEVKTNKRKNALFPLSPKHAVALRHSILKHVRAFSRCTVHCTMPRTELAHVRQSIHNIQKKRDSL